jgi:hypothetical protein
MPVRRRPGRAADAECVTLPFPAAAICLQGSRSAPAQKCGSTEIKAVLCAFSFSLFAPLRERLFRAKAQS